MVKKQKMKQGQVTPGNIIMMKHTQTQTRKTQTRGEHFVENGERNLPFVLAFPEFDRDKQNMFCSMGSKFPTLTDIDIVN